MHEQQINLHIRKREIPIPAIIGGLATGGTWLIVVYTHDLGRIVGFAWIGVGLIIYIIYRKATHRPIIAIPKPKTPTIKQ